MGCLFNVWKEAFRLKRQSSAHLYISDGGLQSHPSRAQLLYSHVDVWQWH